MTDTDRPTRAELAADEEDELDDQDLAEMRLKARDYEAWASL